MTNTLRVVLVDDHAMFRRGVRAEIDGAGGAGAVVGLVQWFRWSARPSDVDTAVKTINEARPDVVLLDVHLPGGGGAEVLRRDRAEPATRRAFLARQRLGRRRGRHRGHPRWRAGLRHEEHQRPGAGRQRSGGSHDGDAVFSPRLAGFVLDAFAGHDRGRRRSTRTWTA